MYSMPGCAAYCMWSVLFSLHYSVGPWKLNGSPLPPGLEQVCKAWQSGLIFKADLCPPLMARFLRSRVWRLTTCVSLDELQGRKNSHFSVCLSLWELWRQFASSRNFRPCKWKTRLVNKLSLERIGFMLPGSLARASDSPDWKEFQVHQQKYPGKGALEASLSPWPEEPCSIIQKSRITTFLEIGRGLLWKEHIKLSSGFPSIAVDAINPIYSGSVVSKMKYRELDTFQICWITHLNVGINLRKFKCSWFTMC